MTRKLILLTGLIIWGVAALAQQAPQYSLYFMNPLSFNPAYAGMETGLSANGVVRKQWSGIPGSPSQQQVNVHSPLYFLNSGLGLSLENDQLGARRYTSGMLYYNYQHALNRNTLLSAGIGAGLVQFTWDGSKLRTPDGTYSDGQIDHADQLLTASTERGAASQLQAGLFLKNERLQAGISVNNLAGGTINLDRASIPLDRHYFAFAEYRFDLGTNLVVSPSVLFKSDLNQHQVDLTAEVAYNDNVFLGASLRGVTRDQRDALVLFGGLRLSAKTRLGYAYDLTLSDLGLVQDGSHEFLLQYQLGRTFGKGKLPKVIYNPRFL